MQSTELGGGGGEEEKSQELTLLVEKGFCTNTNAD